MVNIVKTSFDISLDEPSRARPGMEDFLEGRVASASRSETVRAGAKLRLVVCFQDRATELLQQFIRPGRDPQRAQLGRAFLLDISASHTGPSVSLASELLDDVEDLLLRHPIHGLLGHTSGHGSLITIEATVGPQIEIRVVESSIDITPSRKYWALLRRRA